MDLYITPIKSSSSKNLRIGHYREKMIDYFNYYVHYKPTIQSQYIPTNRGSIFTHNNKKKRICQSQTITCQDSGKINQLGSGTGTRSELIL